jgi:hypothetical protein
LKSDLFTKSKILDNNYLNRREIKTTPEVSEINAMKRLYVFLWRKERSFLN